MKQPLASQFMQIYQKQTSALFIPFFFHLLFNPNTIYPNQVENMINQRAYRIKESSKLKQIKQQAQRARKQHNLNIEAEFKAGSRCIEVIVAKQQYLTDANDPNNKLLSECLAEFQTKTSTMKTQFKNKISAMML